MVERDRVLKGPIARFIERLSTWVIRHRYLILATIVLIAVAFGFALRHVSYRTNYLSYYRKKERVVRDSRVLVRRFGGYTNIYLTIEAPGGKNNYFLDPQVLRKISDFENRLSADPDICYIFSFNQYLKLMNLKASGSFTVTEHRAPILLLSRYIKSIVSSPHGQSVDARPINEQFSSLTTTLRAWDGADESLLMEPELKALIARIEELIESELDIEARTVIWGRALAILPAILSMGSGSAAGPGAESRLKVESGG